MAPQPAVSDVTQQGQQEEQGGAFVGPPHHARHRLGVNWVGGEQQAGQQAPRPPAQQQASQRGEQDGHGAVQRHVDGVVAPGLQAAHRVVQAEGQGAEGPVGLVAAAVGQQGSPEVIVKDVGPGRLRKQVLIGLNGSAGKRKTEKR